MQAAADKRFAFADHRALLAAPHLDCVVIAKLEFDPVSKRVTNHRLADTLLDGAAQGMGAVLQAVKRGCYATR